ncbi:MAG: hypothetical protein M1827_006580 [Pycnora praestabilis]|nr:MAG: hypothetical protein M1827_006580 [Pycnora praestabilis]
MAKSSLQIVCLPQESDSKLLAEMVARYKAFHLQALRLAPEAFVLTYEEQLKKPDDVYEHQLKAPLVKIFVATQTDAASSEESLEDDRSFLKSEWVGMIVLHGPRVFGLEVTQGRSSPWDVTHCPDSSSTHTVLNAFEIPHFHINGLFTIPAARGRGLGHDLIQAVCNCAKDLTTQNHANSVKLTVSVDSSNAAAKGVYAKCGFVVVGEHEIGLKKSYRYKEAEASQMRSALSMEQVLFIES